MSAIYDQFSANLTAHVIKTAQTYTMIRPNIQVLVQITVILIKTLQLSPSGSLDVGAVLSMKWFDTRMAWNPSSYGGIAVVNIPANLMWTPQLYLYNPASTDTTILPDASRAMMVKYNGSITWYPPRMFSSSCTMDYTNFPFDTQTCSLIFVASEFTNSGYDYVPAVVLMKDSFYTNVSTELYAENGEFMLVSTSTSSSGEGAYQCAVSYCFPAFIITLTYKRKSDYYLLNLLIPVALLTLIVPFALILPSDNSVKITMACSLMVSLYVLQQNVSRILPASVAWSRCALGTVASLIIGCLCVIGTIVSICVRMQKPSAGPKFIEMLQFFSCNKLTKKTNRIQVMTEKSSAPHLQLKTDKIEKSTASLGVEEPIDGTGVIISANANTSFNTGSDKLVEQMRVVANLLEKQIRLQEAEAQRIRQSAENASSWRTADIFVNSIVFVLFFFAALVAMLVLEFQFG